MPEKILRFGTDGWRAVVGKDFTVENVRRVAAATAEWLIDQYGANSSVVIGHDPRSLGPEAARMTARVLAASGIQVYFGKNITPTPAISWATLEYACNAGIVITASHNPPEYNGFKVKGHFGGSALPEMIKQIEQHLHALESVHLDLPTFESLESEGRIVVRSVRAEYIRMLRDRFDIAAIRDQGIRIVHDAMYGAGRAIFSELLGEDHVLDLHSDLDPTFGGVPPEPIERNLAEMPQAVRKNAYSAGIANDGDADRIGMCDENGEFVDSHRLLALLLRYLHEDTGLSGDVVKTFSTTDMIDTMGRLYGLTVHTTPIGFKYISGLFLDGEVLLGGEESGGIAVDGHVPDRDGIYIGMMILEMMAHRRKSLSELVEDLYVDFGRHAYSRTDVHTSEAAKQNALRLLKDEGGLRQIAGRTVTGVETLDGYKHRVDGAWLLIRPSGTEPVLRVYSEAPDMASAEANIEDAIRQLGV